MADEEMKTSSGSRNVKVYNIFGRTLLNLKRA